MLTCSSMKINWYVFELVLSKAGIGDWYNSQLFLWECQGFLLWKHKKPEASKDIFTFMSLSKYWSFCILLFQVNITLANLFRDILRIKTVAFYPNLITTHDISHPWSVSVSSICLTLVAALKTNDQCDKRRLLHRYWGHIISLSWISK